MRRIFLKLLAVNEKKCSEEITSVEELNLRVSGMRGERVYEMLEKDDALELTLYRTAYKNDRYEWMAEKSAVCKNEEILELINSCHLLRWDGFVGKHPRGIHDGDMFNFVAKVNGGRQIKANGSANFPAGYREFTSGLEKLLNPPTE